MIMQAGSSLLFMRLNYVQFFKSITVVGKIAEKKACSALTESPTTQWIRMHSCVARQLRLVSGLGRGKQKYLCCYILILDPYELRMSLRV